MSRGSWKSNNPLGDGFQKTDSEVVLPRRLSLCSAETTVTEITRHEVDDRGGSEVNATSSWDNRGGLPHAQRRRSGYVYQGKIQLDEENEVKIKWKVKDTKRFKQLARGSRYIVDNKYVVFVSVVLTFYALLGDDIRLLTTDAGADETFNALTIFCITFFSVEVMLSCFGKIDYFLSFFFFLDTIATVTLVMDLSMVNEYIMNGGGDGDLELGDRARTGRTARIGASVGRMVRVLRLLRIFKLYKAYYANKQRQKRQAARQKAKQNMSGNNRSSNGPESAGRATGPGNNIMAQSTTAAAMSGHPSHFHNPENLFDEEQWLEEEEERAMNEEQQTGKESMVSKKLSALTSRRVIILVLALLLVLPSLRVVDLVTPQAPSYAADMIHEAFEEYLQANGSRQVYETAMLKIIYYNNWFTGQERCKNDIACPSDYFAHLFWVGATGIDANFVQARVANAKLSESIVHDWDEAVGRQDDLFNYGQMPPQALPLLWQEWKPICTINGVKQFGVAITEFKISGKLETPFKCPERPQLRRNEWMRITPRMLTNAEYKAFHLVFYFDLRPYMKLESSYGLAVTMFVCIVLVVSSVLFANDANRLVLKPLEQMIAKIEAIRDNPLVAIKMADQEFKEQELKRVQDRQKALHRQQSRSVLTKLPAFMRGCKMPNFKKADDSQEMYETVILEKTLVKLGWLLSLVFGEAGANIVSQNMSGNATAGVNAMVPGMRVECIIGHARIRHFSTVTEVLQAKVMTFVNQVAEIVHGIVDQFHGAANQNNGNTFLLIWRMIGLDQDKVAKMGDMSVVTFAKILGAIHCSPMLAAYRAHPGLQQRLGSDHKVSMTFGLHAGWAIEGAVGSEFKIDASYLSPNVSIASSLERATAQYGVSFLASQAVTRLCHKKTVNKCRLIDKVTLSGFTQPLELYTLDLDCNQCVVDPPRSKSFPVWSVRQRFRARQLLETSKVSKWATDLHLEDSFDEKDILQMRRTYTFEFLCLFNRGYQNYSQGEWQVAKRVLSQTQTMLGVTDGPSSALLKFMEASYQFAAPEGWNGVRTLNLDTHADT